MSSITMYNIEVIKNVDIGPFLLHPIGDIILNGTKVVYWNINYIDISDIAKSILNIWNSYLDNNVRNSEFYMEFNIVYNDVLTILCYIYWKPDKYGITIHDKSYIYYKPVFTYILNDIKYIFKHRNIIKYHHLTKHVNSIMSYYNMNLYDMIHILKSYYALVGYLNINSYDIETELICIKRNESKK